MAWKSLFRWMVVLTAPLSLSAADWPDSRAVENVSRSAETPFLVNSPFDNWVMFVSPYMDSPVLAFGRPVAVDASDPAGSARQMIQVATQSDAEFALVAERTVGRLTRIHYREMREGLPVICGRLDLVLNAQQELMRWSVRDYSHWPVTQRHSLSEADAASLLGGAARLNWILERSERAWFPDHEIHQLRPVYWLRLADSQPDERWEGIVDAATGELLLEWSGIHTDMVTGTVRGPYWQPYIQSPEELGLHRFQTLTINAESVTTDASGMFSYEAGSSAACSTMLRGPYVEVSNEDAPPGHMSLNLNAPFTPFNWDWTIEDAARPELNLYYHTEFIHDWYKVIDPQFNALDYPMPAVANVGSGYDNAYWNGYGTYYGSGSQYQNFAMFSDVIYHEYTHGVTDGIYPDGMLPYTGQPGAMNEAWSDYIACSINGDPLMGEYLNGSPNSFFRDLESTMVFPQNWVGEVHADSPFISAPLWTMRQTIGVGLTDSLAHFARYALAETFFDYLVAVLETDDNDGDLSNGTPHSAVIYDAFGDHGIGPGDNPHFVVEDVNLSADGQGQSVGDGDRFMEQGEIAEMTFVLRNSAPLYPPPATDVQIVVTTSDPQVIITNGQQSVASIPAGSSYQTAPIVLQFMSSAPDHWVVLNVDVTCNDENFTFHHELEFTLGTPHLLIVEDDPTSDVESFIRTVVRAQDKIFDRIAPESGEDVPAETYPGYGLVIWLSGNELGNILTSQDQARLTLFMNGGNKVVFSGQNIVDELAGSAFLENVLEVEVLDDSVTSHATTATAAPFVPGEWFLLTGSGGAANQTDPEALNPTGASQEICHWGRADSGVAAGILCANGNGLLLGFGIEAISGMGGSTGREGFMNDLYAWAGELLGEIDEQSATASPLIWNLGPAYPNPFNSSTTIVYSVPANFHAELFVYDVLGRLVQSRILSASGNTIQWSPPGSSGIYFARIRWSGGQTEPIKLLQLR